MTRIEDADHVPDVVLERHRLGELPGAEAEALERRLRADAELRRKVEALDRSDAEIRRLHPAPLLAERVRSRAATRPSAPALAPGGRWWPLPIALAAGAAVLSLLGPAARGTLVPGPEPTSGDGTDRVKGLKPSLAVFRKTDGHSETLSDGDRARAGDLIRLGYRAAGRRFGVIVSLDGRGQVTLHLPRQGSRAAALQAAEVVLLDHAYELDDAPRWERFFFITSEAPFELGAVVEVARHAPVGAMPPAALALPAPLEQSAFSLEKEARP